MMEGPGVPLVKANGHYTKYVSTDNLIEDGIPIYRKNRMADRKVNLGARLSRRRTLINRRVCVTSVSLCLGVAGFLLTLLNTELIFADVLEYDSAMSVILRVCTSLTTIGLVAAVCMYHILGYRLRMASKSLDDWRLVIGCEDIVKLGVEVLVCSIHPLPFGDVHIPVKVVKMGLSDWPAFKNSTVPVNTILTVLMFLRLYLLGRFIVLQSKLFRDTTVQSLGALSRVNINAEFVFKALMTTMPITCLMVIMVMTIFISSWSLRVCEFYSSPADEHNYFAHALWLTAVTFLTLGYGDIVPRSICGRMIAIFTGLMGVGIMALCVAVLARKLEQSRNEKYVHTFVQQIRMDKMRKNAAADVLKQSILIWRLKKMGFAQDSSRVLPHKRKLLRAVKNMNESQFKATQLMDRIVGTAEVSYGVNEIYKVARTIREEHDVLQHKLETLEKMITSMHYQLHDMRETLIKDREKKE